MSTRDKYDDAVEYLTTHPGEIANAWNKPSVHAGGSLFTYVSNDSRPHSVNYGTHFVDCGCLTQVKRGTHVAWAANDEHVVLTTAIRSDSRLPENVSDITVADLPVFAEWQRRLDREIRGGK